MRWYVIQTESCRERLAEKCVGSLGFGTFQANRESGAYDGKSPLFPGYLFVTFDPMAPGWTRILSAFGVITILGVNRPRVGEHFPPPVPAPNGFVEGLQAYIASVGGVIPKAIPERLSALSQGQRVAITDGPFSGFDALVYADEGERVRVLLDIFGGLSPTMVPRKSVALKAVSAGACLKPLVRGA